MKVYSLLILFCFLQILICDNRVSQKEFKDAVKISLPFIKSFHLPPSGVYSGLHYVQNLEYSKFTYTELNENNIQFEYDELGLFHLKFINIKGQIKGKYRIDNRFSLTKYSNFTAELSNINSDEIFAVNSIKKDNGKQDLHFKSMSEPKISFNIFKVTSNISDQKEHNLKWLIKDANIYEFKTFLKKISSLILETLKNRLK